jgi:hypothetical protein
MGENRGPIGMATITTAGIWGLVLILGWAGTVLAAPTAADLELDPKLLQSSPVLRRWLAHPPDVGQDIAHDPAFRTRLRLGYGQGSGSDRWQIGIADLRVAHSQLTLSADYQTQFDGSRPDWGVDGHYYLRPLGKSVNIAPVVGYRQLANTQGVNLGARLLLVPSRSGGADLALTQTWVRPFSGQSTSLTRLSLGYAVTHQLRVGSDLSWEKGAEGRTDRRLGLALEWMP